MKVPWYGRHMHVEKARVAMRLLKELVGCDLHVDVGYIEHLVSTLNALYVPRLWVGIDDVGRLHLTLLRSELLSAPMLRVPYAFSMYADFVWEHNPLDSTVRCIKSRDGQHMDLTVAYDQQIECRCKATTCGGSVAP